MFGYIHANQQELTEENIVTYRAYYCGLCRCLKELCGKKGRLLLNYDMTFLVIMLSGLYELDNSHESYICPRHPAEKQNVWINEATRYAAKMSVLLSYYNFEDDWKDDKSLIKKMAADSLAVFHREVVKEYPRQAKAVRDYLKGLEEAEKNNEKNVDIVSGLTGQMLSEIFDWKQDEWSSELRCFGFYMGKFIYLMDAYEDEPQDSKKGIYNILSFIREDGDYETYCRLLLTSMMSECAKSFERMPIIRHADICRNVLYSGVWTRYELVQLKLKKKKPKEEKKSD